MSSFIFSCPQFYLPFNAQLQHHFSDASPSFGTFCRPSILVSGSELSFGPCHLEATRPDCKLKMNCKGTGFSRLCLVPFYVPASRSTLFSFAQPVLTWNITGRTQSGGTGALPAKATRWQHRPGFRTGEVPAGSRPRPPCSYYLPSIQSPERLLGSLEVCGRESSP